MKHKRIGIIGTENSHALAFARLFNGDGGRAPLDPDWRVTLVHGEDPATAQAIVDQVAGICAVPAITDMLGEIDAVMVTNRAGSKHAAAARPFIERGLPAFIDKPLTSNLAEARELLELAQKTGSRINSGSGVKYAWDVEILAREAQKLRADGRLLSAALGFAADYDSPYDGFFFYSPHLVEMVLTILGPDIRTVQASRSGPAIVVNAVYDDLVAALLFTAGSSEYFGTLVSDSRVITRTIDLSMIYEVEAKKFLTLLRTGEMAQDFNTQLTSIALIEAILRSLESGRAEALER
ncbi:MAG: Gfo/Idh/MocA family oxidoreductase [Bacillota bacterium]|nr:Gfo/Idh/MocA family oxidoreductase [Bacillota bacterium]